MNQTRPDEALEECVRKLSFLTDTLSLYVFHNTNGISPQGFAGLYEIVSGIERDLSAAAPHLIYQPQGVTQ